MLLRPFFVMLISSCLLTSLQAADEPMGISKEQVAFYLQQMQTFHQPPLFSPVSRISTQLDLLQRHPDAFPIDLHDEVMQVWNAAQGVDGDDRAKSRAAQRVLQGIYSGKLELIDAVAERIADAVKTYRQARTLSGKSSPHSRDASPTK